MPKWCYSLQFRLMGGFALVLALAPAAARVRVERRSSGFVVHTRGRRWNFAFNPQGRALLTLS